MGPADAAKVHTFQSAYLGTLAIFNISLILRADARRRARCEQGLMLKRPSERSHRTRRVAYIASRRNQITLIFMSVDARVK